MLAVAMRARLCPLLLVVLLLLAGHTLAADRSRDPVISRISHQAVHSRGIATVGYSKRLHALEIQFHRGGTYRYLQVPPRVHRELLAAESKARFYNTRIRGKYRSIRVRRMLRPDLAR